MCNEIKQVRASSDECDFSYAKKFWEKRINYDDICLFLLESSLKEICSTIYGKHYGKQCATIYKNR